MYNFSVFPNGKERIKFVVKKKNEYTEWPIAIWINKNVRRSKEWPKNNGWSSAEKSLCQKKKAVAEFYIKLDCTAHYWW